MTRRILGVTTSVIPASTLLSAQADPGGFSVTKKLSLAGTESWDYLTVDVVGK